MGKVTCERQKDGAFSGGSSMLQTYQIYTVDDFPALVPGKPVVTRIQLTLSGQGESIKTSFTLVGDTEEPGVQLLKVKSEVKHETYGYIKQIVESERRTIEFSEYLEKVDFSAFLDRTRQIVVFRAPKRVCRGVLSNIKDNPCGVKLQEMAVDFQKVLQTEDLRYLAAWFKKVSSRVDTAAVQGHQVQEDPLFRELIQDGLMSSVTIDWQMTHGNQGVLVTSSAAVVLTRHGVVNEELEFRIVLDIYERLIKKVWRPKTRKGSASA